MGKYSVGSKKKHFAYFFLFSILLVQYFQNCAPPNKLSVQDQSAQHVALSPFLQTKVVIDTKSPTLNLKGTQSTNQASLSAAQKSSIVESHEDITLPQGSQLVVNIDNACASTQCDTHSTQPSLTCKLYKKYYKIQMENLKQAYVWVLEESQPVNAIEDIIKNDPNQKCVIGVSQREVYKIKDAAFTTNDPDFKYQYYHKTIKGTDVYSFFDTQLNGNPLAEVVVGVIDTGVDFDHPDFANTLSRTKGKNVNLSDACPTELCHFHGTFVSGIIAAQRNNSQGGMGIAPNSIIYSYQVGNPMGQIPSDEIVNALQRALADRVEIINLSLGGGGFGSSDASLQASIVDAINTNISIVVAAGNSNQNITAKPVYPASYDYDSMIVVGSASPQDIPENLLIPATDAQTFSPIKRDFYSNYSSLKVDISAPGRQIYSTSLHKAYGIANGTSFSTPIITGALSLARGYLKTKNFDSSLLSPYVMKSLLLKSADNLDSLNELLNNVSSPVFIKNRFLNMVDFQKSLVDFTDGVSSNNNSISLNSFSVSGSNSLGLTLNFRVEVNTNQLAKNPTMRAYTNKAFKEDTLVSECKVESGRTFCEFQIDATKTGFLIDPGIYFELTDSGGNVIATLDIKKTDLNWGSKQDAEIFGEINDLHIEPEKGTTVRGWTCLKGFPDNLKLEVRKDNPTKKSSDDRFNTGLYLIHRKVLQAKGRYLEQCQSPEVNLGFEVFLNEPGKYYIVALHPTDPAKNKIIPVLKYNPGFQDLNPIQEQNYVYVDPAWLFVQSANHIKILERAFSAGVLTLKLSYCAKDTTNIVRPVRLALSSDLTIEHSIDKIQAANTGPTSVMGTENLNKSEFKYFSQYFSITNPNTNLGSDSDKLGGFTLGASFSNINNVLQYKNRSDTNSTLYWGVSGDQLPEIPDLTKLTNFQIDTRLRSDYSIGSVFASDQSGSCQTNDIYTLTSSIDLGVQNYGMSVSGSYRVDKYPVIKSTDALSQYLDFAEFLKTANANKSSLTLNTLSVLDMNYKLRIDEIHSVDLFSLDHVCTHSIEKLLNPSSNYVSPASIFSSCIYNKNLVLDSFLSSYNLQSTVVRNSDDNLVILAQNTSNLKKATQSLGVYLGFTNGKKLGQWYDNKDLLVEYWDGLNSKWLIAPIDIIKQTKSASGYEGVFAFQVDLPQVQTDFKWRIRGNKMNDLQFTQLVMEAF